MISTVAPRANKRAARRAGLRWGGSAGGFTISWAFSPRDYADGSAPPYPPRDRIACKSIELRASLPPIQRTLFQFRRQNGGFGGRSERRRLAEGQPPVSERSPPSQTKPLRVARLLARGANVQIKACGLNPACAQFPDRGLNPACAQFPGLVRVFFAHNSPVRDSLIPFRSAPSRRHPPPTHETPSCRFVATMRSLVRRCRYSLAIRRRQSTNSNHRTPPEGQ